MQLNRSQINASIRLAIDTFNRFGASLPSFAYWSVDEWQLKGREAEPATYL